MAAERLSLEWLGGGVRAPLTQNGAQPLRMLRVEVDGAAGYVDAEGARVLRAGLDVYLEWEAREAATMREEARDHG